MRKNFVEKLLFSTFVNDSNSPRHWTIRAVELVIHLDFSLVENMKERGREEELVLPQELYDK